MCKLHLLKSRNYILLCICVHTYVCNIRNHVGAIDFCTENRQAQVDWSVCGTGCLNNIIYLYVQFLLLIITIIPSTLCTLNTSTRPISSKSYAVIQVM